MEYKITAVSDPYGCNTNPVTGLINYGPNGPTTGPVSIYRRPLPSTNLGFLTTIMWDGRATRAKLLRAAAIDARGRRHPTYSALTDCTVQPVGMLPTAPVDVIAVPLMNHIAVFPLPSRHIRSLLPSPS
jgi:hypothetical protein